MSDDDMTDLDKRQQRLLSLNALNTTDQEKRELYAYMVFKIIINVALARQRKFDIGVNDTEVNQLANQILLLPFGALELVANAMINIMQNTHPIRVDVIIPRSIFKTFFKDTEHEFYTRNEFLKGLFKLNYCFTTEKSKNIRVNFYSSTNEGEYNDIEYENVIGSFITDILNRNNLVDYTITFEHLFIVDYFQ